jgi:hypothetical protein
MVVLYGGLLLISVYLTYLTMKSREKSHEIKRLKLVSKEYRLEIATLKAKLKTESYGRETERRTETEASTTAGSRAIDRNGRESNSTASGYTWWKTVRQSF